VANEPQSGSGAGKKHEQTLERIEQRRKLAQLSSKGKLDALISVDDAAGLIRSVPAEDLYFAIVDVGLADALDVIQLASPQQFRTFVDLGGWKRDSLEVRPVLAWLRAARGEDLDAFVAKLTGLDMEVLEILLRTQVVVHSLEDDPDVNPQRPTMETPEGKYLLEITAEEADYPIVREILTDLIAQNPFEAVRLLEAVRWEVLTELEEQAYQFRQARLGDLGFPPLEEAAALFSRVKLPPRPEGAPGLTGPARVDYLDAALRGLSAEERDNLQDELRYLVNSALVAEGAEPGDVGAIREVSERARDYLALALERLAASPERAADVVRDTPSRRVFQVGFSLTLELKHRADRIAQAPLARVGEAWMVAAPELAGFQALRRKRPLRALKVEGAEPVAFRSLRELAESHQLLDLAEAAIATAAALCGPTQKDADALLANWPGEVSFERLLTAAVAHALSSGSATVAPLSPAQARDFLERVVTLKDGKAALNTGALATATQAIAARVPAPLASAVGALTQRLLESLVSELGPSHLQGRVPEQVLETLLPISPPEGQ